MKSARRRTPPSMVLISALAAALIAAGSGGSVEAASSVEMVSTDVDVGGGRSLHLVCGGPLHAPGPTVLALAGYWSDSSDFVRLVEVLDEASIRMCAYDRAGLGMSDPPPGVVTTADGVADLHALLDAADIAPPYVLLGHSLGGWHARVFTARYPDEVVGFVFLDPGHPDQDRRLVAALPPANPDEDPRMTSSREGLDYTNRRPEDEPELIDLVASAAEVRDSGDLGDRPIVVLTSDHQFDAPEPFRERLATAWLAMQMEYASLSTAGSQRVVPGAGHEIHLDRPEAVIDAIQEVLEDIGAVPSTP